MVFRLVSDDEIDRLRDIDTIRGAIRRKLTVLFDALKKEFNGNTTGGISGLQFEVVDDPRIIAIVKTPYGNARCTLTYSFEGSLLIGVVVVSREKFDQLDRTYWEPVYNFVMADAGTWRPFNKAETANYLHKDTATSIWGLGAGIQYAILSGPIEK